MAADARFGRGETAQERARPAAPKDAVATGPCHRVAVTADSCLQSDVGPGFVAPLLRNLVSAST